MKKKKWGRGFLWSEEEKNFVRNLVERENPFFNEIYRRYNEEFKNKRTYGSLKSFCRYENLKLKSSRWSEYEIGIVKSYKKLGESDKKVAERLTWITGVKRSEKSIVQLRHHRRLELIRPRWKESEVKLVKKYAKQKYSSTEISKLLRNHGIKKSRQSITGVCKRNGITLHGTPNQKMRV